jgi:acetolactate synthase-1/2/3 large subunit
MNNKQNLKKLSSLTGGQSLIRCLYNEGIRVIFGLPDVQMYHTIIPILDYPDMKFITTRHEQATTYMADGYARAGGKIEVPIGETPPPF